MRNILEVLEFVKKEDPFGVTLDDPLYFMTWEEALSTGLLREEYVQKVKKGEEKWECFPYTPKNVIERMKEYMEFAWDKANNCRGLSAWRSLQHYRNWFYMFGDEDMDMLVEEMKNYEYYGKPWLAIICEILNIDWEKLDDGYWDNSEDTLERVSKEWKWKIVNEYGKRIPFIQIKKKIEDLMKNER